MRFFFVVVPIFCVIYSVVSIVNHFFKIVRTENMNNKYYSNIEKKIVMRKPLDSPYICCCIRDFSLLPYIQISHGQSHGLVV